MVPASTFMYGSILMEETFRPIVLSSRPVEEAERAISRSSCASFQGHAERIGHCQCLRVHHVPMTPFPMPLMTPPDTKTYFILDAPW